MQATRLFKFGTARSHYGYSGRHKNTLWRRLYIWCFGAKPEGVTEAGLRAELNDTGEHAVLDPTTYNLQTIEEDVTASRMEFSNKILRIVRDEMVADMNTLDDIMRRFREGLSNVQYGYSR